MKKPNNPIYRHIKLFTLAACLLMCGLSFAQNGNTESKTKKTATDQKTEKKYRVYLDVLHGQKFWNNPDNMVENAGNHLERVRYMTSQLESTVSAAEASIGYFESGITSKSLKDCDLLFIHIPSAQYSEKEVAAIIKYIKRGGSLFLVMDVDYWSSLEQTNVNDLIRPFDIQFGGNSADTLSGGHTKAGEITNEPIKVIYHGARTLTGGTPFCFNDQSEEPFGVYKELENGGKIIVMGDGMVSVYMNAWAEVQGYPSQEFMRKVFRWLLK